MAASNTGIGKRGIDVLHDPRLNKSTALYRGRAPGAAGSSGWFPM